MLESLASLFGPSLVDKDDSSIAAYAIPTFAHPKQSLPFPSDTEQLTNLLNVTAEEKCRVNLASAYLNPTPSLLSSLKRQSNECTLLTAGPLSHGFAPKPGVQRTGDFVPKFFMYQAQTLAQEQHPRVLLYNRPGWTFHAKGLWVLSEEGNLVAAVVGSGNYGYRSERRDVESNLILVFPQETSPFQEELLEEWERFMEYATEPTFEEPSEPQVRAIWPVIQSYF
jgi:CDP-diacylglycerol--glycerol-3-phosphate 3-phosphatidyltransferase